MKKLLFLFALAAANISFSQTYRFTMETIISTSYPRFLDLDSLREVDYGPQYKIGYGIVNTYEIDAQKLTINYYQNNQLMESGNILSFTETDEQIQFTFMDYGYTSKKEFIRTAVYNKHPKPNKNNFLDPAFLIYHHSKVDNKSTICYYTHDVQDISK